MASCRLIPTVNKWDDTRYAADCTTRVSVENLVPELELKPGDEFSPKYQHDAVHSHLVRWASSDEGLLDVQSLNIRFDVLLEATDDIEEPVCQYQYRFVYGESVPCNNLKGIEPDQWINWILRLFVIGSLDDDQYRFELSETHSLVVRCRANGIYIVIFECPLVKVDLDDSIDIMGDLRAEYKRARLYKSMVRSLQADKAQLIKDYDSSLSASQKYIDINRDIRRRVESVFLPLLNEQKTTIFDLQRQLGHKQDLEFSSLRKNQLLNPQEPDKVIDFSFDESKVEEYRKEVAEVSPKKKKKKKEKKRGTKRKKEVSSASSTDADSDSEPVLKRSTQSQTQRASDDSGHRDPVADPDKFDPTDDPDEPDDPEDPNDPDDPTDTADDPTDDTDVE